MGQVIVLVIILIIAKLIVDFVKEQFSFGKKTTQTGDVIDISDAWVDTSTLPYKKKASIFSKKEISFYYTLDEILGKDYILCPRMQMSQLLLITESPKQKEYLQRLQERALDLTVLESGTFRPVLVFILEDNEPGINQHLSNSFTAKALQAAHLPLITVNLSQNTNPQYLIQELRKHGLNI